MKRKERPVTTSEFKTALEKSLKPIRDRLVKLEDVVFPKRDPGGGGPGGGSADLQALRDRVDQLASEFARGFYAVDLKFRELVEIVAELQRLVSALSGQRISTKFSQPPLRARTAGAETAEE